MIPGLPTSLPANMKEDEQKLYISKTMYTNTKLLSGLSSDLCV